MLGHSIVTSVKQKSPMAVLTSKQSRITSRPTCRVDSENRLEPKPEELSI